MSIRPRFRLVVLAGLLLLLGIGPQQSAGTLSANADQVGEWSSVVSWPAMAKHMILLPYDKALVFSTGADVQLWNIGSNTFKPVPATFGDLHCAGHVTLADGRAFVVGGQEGSPFIGTKVAATFDPVTESWTSRTPMHYARWYPTATTLPDGRVFVTGGTDEGKGKVRIPEIYDPATDTWTELPAAAKTQPLYPFMYVDPTSGRLYDAAPAARTEFLDLSGGGSWSPGPISGWDNLAGGCCSEAGAMYDIGKIIRTGGGDPAHARTGVIDLTAVSPAWRETAPMAFARRRQNLVILADGNVMAVGGTAAADDPAQAVLAGEIWDRDTETWKTVASMATPRMYHSSAMLLPDGRVVSAGGDHPNATSKLTAQFYSPPYLFKGPRPLISTAPDAAGYGMSFAIGTPTAGISSVALIRSGAPTHAIDMNQRYVPLAFTQAGSQLSVQAPASGNVAPPGYYMLVIEGADGIPSVGRWIKIGANAGGPPPPPPANRPPTANFAASTTAGPAPLAVDFSDTSSDAPEAWEWDFQNDGTIDSTVRNPRFTYSTPGAYTVRLVARNAFGSDEEVKVGYVNVGAVAPPPPSSQTQSFSVVADARVLEASPTRNYGSSYLRVDGAADPDIESYFRFDLGSITGQITSAKLRVFATSGSVNGPAVYAANDHSIIWGENAITWANRPTRGVAALDDKGSVQANTVLEYDVTQGVSAGGPRTFVLATDSTDGVDVSSREVVDVTRRAELVVTWAQAPQPKPPVADFSVSPASGTAPLTVSFTDTSQGATSWAWDFTNDDSFESTHQNPTFTYADPGVYSVRLFVENDYGGDEVIKTAVVTVTAPAPQSTTTVFTPVADAYVKSDAASTNYGKSSALRIDAIPQVNSYLRFDVAGLAGPVVSAKLRLFVTDAGSNAGAVYPVSPLWIETGTGALTWANAPAISGTPLPGGGAAPLNTWVEFDVSGAVAANGPVAFAVKGLTSDAAYYSSKEGLAKPQLVIESAGSPGLRATHAQH